MDVGALNRVVEFQANNPVTLGAGKKDVYTTLLTTRGSLKMLSAGRALSYGNIEIGKGFECVVRFQTLLESNIRPDLRVVIDDRTFTVHSWEKVGEKRFYYKFILNER